MTTEPTPLTRIPRLRLWYAKMLYVIAAIIIYYLGGGLAPTDNSRGILRSALLLVLVLLAARLFRTAAEPDAPRPLWRMTGRPTAGFVLGIVLAIFAIGFIGIASQVGTSAAFASLRSQQASTVAATVVFIALAVLYITSSIRLVGIAREARVEAARSRKRGSSSSSSED
jgi:uncharacterized membrane protein YfcA